MFPENYIAWMMLTRLSNGNMHDAHVLATIFSVQKLTIDIIFLNDTEAISRTTAPILDSFGLICMDFESKYGNKNEKF